jgi:hypothetical protein
MDFFAISVDDAPLPPLCRRILEKTTDGQNDSTEFYLGVKKCPLEQILGYFFVEIHGGRKEFDVHRVQMFLLHFKTR